MNIPALIVACITLLAFLGHVFGGTRETAAIAPDRNEAKLTTHWIQAMAAFQMLAVDLLVVSGILFAIVFADLGAIERILLLILSGVFFLWGAVWLIQMIWLKDRGISLFKLPHWIIWFVCSALLYFAA